MTRTAIKALVGGGFLLLGAACASTAERTAPGQEVTITVQNDITPATPVTVFAIDETGLSRRIGYVAGNRRTTLIVPFAGGSRQLRFSADPDGTPPAATAALPPSFSDLSRPDPPRSAVLFSEPIHVGQSSRLLWALQGNILVPEE